MFHEHVILKYTFLKKIAQFSCVKKIILFGSRARQDNMPLSDIDVAIDCSGATDKEWCMILAIVDNADTLLHIDCIRYDKLSDDSAFKKQIDKDAVIIYEK